MTEETEVEAPAPKEKIKQGKGGGKHAFEVVRGFWGEDGEKVAKGSGIELTAEEAMAPLASGIVKPMAVKE